MSDFYGTRRPYRLRPSQQKIQEAKELQSKVLFTLTDGTPVTHGQTLYVHPSFIESAGLTVTAEFEAKGALVTTRATNGAVPQLPIALLSNAPFPNMEIKCAIADKLKINVWDVTERDVGIFKLGMKSNLEC